MLLRESCIALHASYNEILSSDTDFGKSRNARLLLFIFGAMGRILYIKLVSTKMSYNVLMNTAICDERFFTQQEYIHIYDV